MQINESLITNHCNYRVSHRKMSLTPLNVNVKCQCYGANGLWPIIGYTECAPIIGYTECAPILPHSIIGYTECAPILPHSMLNCSFTLSYLFLRHRWWILLFSSGHRVLTRYLTCSFHGDRVCAAIVGMNNCNCDLVRKGDRYKHCWIYCWSTQCSIMRVIQRAVALNLLYSYFLVGIYFPTISLTNIGG